MSAQGSPAEASRRVATGGVGNRLFAIDSRPNHGDGISRVITDRRMRPKIARRVVETEGGGGERSD